MAESPAPRVPPHYQARPTLWRLPLIAFLVIGIACLSYLDTVLVREYRTEAASQALRTSALLESYFRQRGALLHGVEALLADARSDQEAMRRFSTFGREITADSRRTMVLYLIDSSGVVRDVYPQTAALRRHLGASQYSDPERSVAIERARRTLRPAMTSTLGLGLIRDTTNARSDNPASEQGVVLYEPILRGTTVAGFVGLAFRFETLFDQAIAGQLEGKFAYRIRDAAGNAIAVSPRYPEHVSAIESQAVVLERGSTWHVDVPVQAFHPLMPRLILWLVGLLLLLVVVFLVIREEARAHRIAAHSYDLELLSRDLLEANVRLEERAVQVEAANRAKSRFLANVSHELRTPLNAIVGYNSLALEDVYGEVEPPLRGALERIAAASDHLLGVVDDILDLSKIEVGRMDVERTPVDVTELLRNILLVVESSAEAKGVRIDLVPPKLLPRIVSDARHLRQIVLNLVSNAIKFTERGVITIAACPLVSPAGETTGIQISVEDTGIGIAAEDIDRIFHEFEQVRPSGRGDSQQRGTGLGLAIARKLAVLLGGDVRVESRLGAGSRFTVSLPLETPAPPATAGAATSPSPAAGEAGTARETPLAPDEDECEETSPAEGAAHATHDASDDESRTLDGARGRG